MMTAARCVPGVGEETLTMIDDRWYASEDIAIHEFSHTVMVRIP